MNYEGEKEREIFSQKLESVPGIMNLSLPNLTAGKQYRWQVVLYCNPDRPYNTLIAGAQIAVVAMPPDLKVQLEATTDPLKKADLYAESGFWYDALGTVLALPENQQAKNLKISLLEDLSRLEAASDAEYVREQSVRLNTIVLTLGNP